MNEQLGNSENDFLWKLLADPADSSRSHVYSLQSLVNEFPQSGVLRALLVPKGDDQHLKHAAAYFTPGTLYKMISDAGSLPRVSASQIVYSEEPSEQVTRNYSDQFIPPVETNYFHIPAEQDIAYIDVEEDEDAIADDIYDEQQDIEDILTQTGHTAIDVSANAAITEEEVQDIFKYIPEDNEETAHNEFFVPAEETAPVNEPLPETYAAEERATESHEAAPPEMSAGETTGQAYVFEGKEEQLQAGIEDEVYDEIVSIEDINLEQLALLNNGWIEKEPETNSEPNINNYDSDIETGTDQNKHFVFEQPRYQNEVQAESELPVIVDQEKKTGGAGATHDVSRYNDEKMPYTFMWWLAKTRREHAATYQPYVTNNPMVAANKKPALPDELQQQYYENIFNINSVNDLDKNTSAADVQYRPVRKEDRIIERFIQEEPQIKHPSTVKLNNDNKAKKSSEDRDELVTETLARIYAEQMLYHKAILTYKKLMLKFPEKSLYFAGQIEQLENKIN